MKDFFKNFVSATSASTGNQSFFVSDGEKKMTSRVYYKLGFGGKNTFSLLYSNIIDTTYADGSHSRRNRVLEPYNIHRLKVGVTESCECEKAVEPSVFKTLSFDGEFEKNVNAGEFFCTDEFVLEAKKGDYLCVEMTFSGSELPYHPECVIPIFTKDEAGFVSSKLAPLPAMVGIKRKDVTRIAFWGDSITQGCGTPMNSYTHYAARIAEMLGEGYAVWDIGIGYARADDAASGGAWMYKARHNDIAVIAFGVNDILHEGKNYGADGICRRLKSIVEQLKEYGVKVIIQSTPTYSYNEENTEKWLTVNKYVKEVLAPMCDGYFDNTYLLSEFDAYGVPRYNAHPNSEGHRVWAEQLGEYLKSIL